MQRASSTNTRPTTNRATPTSQSNTPAPEPALKRQKTDHTPDSSNPTTPATEPRAYVSRSDIKAAIQAEATFEALARAKRAELGFGHNEYETEWVLNVSVPNEDNVNGRNDAESGSESEEDGTTGRQTYGGYKRRKKNAAAASTPASKTNTPAQSYKFDDFDSDEEEEGSSDGEIDSDEDNETRTPSGGYGSGRKRKANQIDEADETAMSALDRVDLSKTGYAKAKGATPTGGKKWGDQGKDKDKQKEKKGKYQARGARGRKLGRKR